MAQAVEQQLDAAVRQALGVHAGADAGFVEQVDRNLFQHAGADAAQHVVRRVRFEDDGVDVGLVQQLAEDQSGGAGADDGDLGSHFFSLWGWGL